MTAASTLALWNWTYSMPAMPATTGVGSRSGADEVPDANSDDAVAFENSVRALSSSGLYLNGQ
jgi:hypothetical protein